MSKRNKVNPGQYTQAGRLSPDDAAREERKTASLGGISNRETAAEERDKRQPHPPRDAGASSSFESPASEKVEGAFGRETGEK